MAVGGDGVEVESGSTVPHEDLHPLIGEFGVHGHRRLAVTHGIGQGLASGGDDDLRGAVGDAVAHDNQFDLGAVAVLDLPDEVADGVGH